ncbi:MAG: archease [Deltaproteobacteria bacterium]|nr:archease [Deltaproteobacteria bacterium]
MGSAQKSRPDVSPVQVARVQVVLYNEVKMERFSIIDHEADICVEIRGESLEQLYSNAASALFSIMIEVEDTSAEECVKKKVEIKRNGELLISFLNELLFLWETEGLVLYDLSVELTDDALKATLWGSKFNPEIHTVKKVIKAATYHNFEIKRDKKGYIARVVFDV